MAKIKQAPQSNMVMPANPIASDRLNIILFFCGRGGGTPTCSGVRRLLIMTMTSTTMLHAQGQSATAAID